MTALELEMVELKKRVARLESTVRRLTGETQPAAPPAPGELFDREKLLAWLKVEGLIIDPPLSVHIYAQRWEALPEEEKRAIQWELDHLPPGPMASDIIIENRR